MRFCNRCGCKVDVETEIPHYKYVCWKHDENLDDGETYVSYDIIDILYGCYLHEWIHSHYGKDYDGMDPVCFYEFMDNEFRCEEYMEYILTLYGMHHKIADYRKFVRWE